VILSAVVPTLIAQTWFRPTIVAKDDEELDAALEPVPVAHLRDGHVRRQALAATESESKV
jgi:hypothetical protein